MDDGSRTRRMEAASMAAGEVAGAALPGPAGQAHRADDAHVGAYLGNRVLSRCVEDGDCLLWTVNVNRFGLPVYKNKSLRRLVWTWLRGPLKPGELVGVSCEHDNCLLHLKKTTKSQASIKGNVSFDVRKRRAAALQITKRAASKITIEDARAIRASDEPLAVLGDRYGITPAMASKIRTNRCWRDSANPFAGLGARP